MKKVYLIGALAAMLLGACSGDDGQGAGSGAGGPQGGQAYLTVRIMDAGTATRATGNSTAPFENGTDGERKVTDARFFFYDGAGKFVTEASVWNGGTATTGKQNVEFNGNSVIVLQGLEETGYPKYMVTVLNAPAAFVPGETLTEMETARSGGIYTAAGTADNFIMSTTSYARPDATPYYVTELKSTDFHAEPATPSAIDVYVERLAAKVTLNVSSALSQSATGGRYKLNVTVAGDDNNDEGAMDIYVELLGWGLNATAKNSYMMKNIDPAWANTDASLGTGWTWNDQTNFRSYWAKSCNYADTKDKYPANAADVAADKNNELTLSYISANDISDAAIDGKASAYCAENTFGADVAATPSARTSILLKAKICDKDGNGLDVLRYNGMLFKQDAYLAYVLNAQSAKLNAWLLTSGTAGQADAKYAQIDGRHVELVNVGDGKVKVQLKKDLTATLYKYENGAYTAFTDADKTALNETLADFNKSNPAIGYKGGLMYYNIPIEHLRPITGADIKEANYGVVRNHHYVVTINKLENVGKGIFDPSEVIVPGTETENTYYVGASIKILSWKIVNQGVDL